MKTFVAQVANFFGHGNTRTDYEDGSWSRDVISCTLGRYRLRIKQDRAVITNELRPDGFVHTTQIEVAGVKKYSEGETIVNDVCWLLSLASVSQVVVFECTFDHHRRRRSVSGESMYFRPLIEIKDGNQVSSFLQQVWPTYRRLKRKRKLAEVIDMLAIAELPRQPLVVKLAITFVTLENLKATYARAEGIPFVNGWFRDKKGGRLCLQQLLKGMFRKVGMRPSLKRVISLRNEIIHSGLSRRPYEAVWKRHDRCQDLIREYLLRLLSYKGRYLLYSEASRRSRLLR